MTGADIAVLGAGPAGAAAALVLAPRYRVVLIDRQGAPRRRIGESLIPAARRLLRDMKILEAFEAEAHAPYLGNRSTWGSAETEEVDFLRDPDGPGWHLDRPGFEAFLRAAARQRGARLLAPAELQGLRRSASRWCLALDGPGGRQEIAVRLVIDAGGRAAPFARRLGVKRRNEGRLVAAWLQGTVIAETASSAGFSSVEAAPDGWWYSAPLGGASAKAGRILAFHGDPRCGALPKEPGALLEAAEALPGLGPLLDKVGFAPAGAVTVTAANSAFLPEPAGEGWLAIGDAALSFDPLASRGLFNALYTAMAGAMACHAVLQGQAAGFADYAADLLRVRRAYDRQLALAYAAETRWPEHPFWAARLAAGKATASLRA